MSTAPAEITRFDAENATSLTVDFLKRLGYKGAWLPLKVTLDGELYVVEMMLQKLTAKVQINSTTKEIREYEFQENEQEENGFMKKNGKLLLFFVIIAIAGVGAAHFLGVF
jgi:hypothetical protein